MYDYIIVGAGSAGCTLAGRLTEDPQISVLLLEAGGIDDKQEIHIPAAFSKLFKTSYDWNYATEEEPQMANRKMYWPRGKVLGGSSSINAMIYIRGHRQDYDAWQTAGNEGWSYDDVLPYFMLSENQERGADAYHGVGGPLNVADQRSPNPLSHAFVEGCAEIGIPLNNDFNGAVNEGAGFFQVTQKEGARWSAADAFLHPALGRPNLTVRTGALVTRVLIADGRAGGVAYLVNGRLAVERAEREVLLCGGAINSPQLLMLSGIGPADHLRSLGIEVAVNLPGVGENLQDHLAGGAVYFTTRPISLNNAERAGNILKYLIFKKGPLTSPVAEAGAFIKTRSDASAPDIEFHFAPIFFRGHGLEAAPGHGFTIGPTLLHPRSRGRIRLRSNDPTAPALIHANYFQNEEDVRVMLAGLKIAHEIAHARAFAALRGAELEPGTWQRPDSETIQVMRATSETLYHPCGTCKMGPTGDEMAVVDPQLRVRGIAGLRVIDASIMPTVVGGNTNAPTIMIAEKAVDLLRSSVVVSAVTEEESEKAGQES